MSNNVCVLILTCFGFSFVFGFLFCFFRNVLRILKAATLRTYKFIFESTKPANETYWPVRQIERLAPPLLRIGGALWPKGAQLDGTDRPSVRPSSALQCAEAVRRCTTLCGPRSSLSAPAQCSLRISGLPLFLYCTCLCVSLRVCCCVCLCLCVCA